MRVKHSKVVDWWSLHQKRYSGIQRESSEVQWYFFLLLEGRGQRTEAAQLATERAHHSTSTLHVANGWKDTV